MLRVLVIATSRMTRGGITSVNRAYEATPMWKKFHCHWVQTHRDGAFWIKILYFLSGMLDFLVRVPFYDIVHIHTADYGTQKRKRIFIWLAKLFNKKVIVHLHSSGPEYSIGGKYRGLYDYSFSIADRILVLSTQWRDMVLSNYDIDSKKIIVLYNPCPLIPKHLLLDNDNKSDKYILFAGTLTRRKGYEDLIKAFAKIAPQYPEWQVWFAGNGEIEKAKRLAKDLSIYKQVKFLGWISGSDKDAVFRNASIYCLPSYSEGFPMGVLDAWAYHLPVVSTPVGGLPDVAVNGKNMLLFTPGDINELSIALNSLISNTLLYKQICNASVDLADYKFNVFNITSELENIYNSLDLNEKN